MSEKRIITDVNISGELTVDEDVTTDQHFKQAAEQTVDDHAVNKKALDKEINTLMVTLTQVRNRLDAVESGLSHGVNVEDVLDFPPTTAHEGMFWIVGPNPRGNWAGHADEVVQSQADGSWSFTVPDIGDTHYVETTSQQLACTARGWVKIAGTQGPSAAGFHVGSIQQSLLTETEFRTSLSQNEESEWVLADGRNVVNTEYHKLTGRYHVPDLRGAYIRMSGRNSSRSGWDGGNLLSWQDDSTRMPRNAFSVNSGGGHRHSIWTEKMNYDWSGAAGKYPQGGHPSGTPGEWTSQDATPANQGSHTHGISGGDSETRPKTFTVNYFIKIGDKA